MLEENKVEVHGFITLAKSNISKTMCEFINAKYMDFELSNIHLFDIILKGYNPIFNFNNQSNIVCECLSQDNVVSSVRQTSCTSYGECLN